MKTLVVGFGSPHGDDQAGWIVVDKLQAQPNLQSGIKLIKSNGNGVDWFSELDSVTQLLVIDAVISNKKPGTLHQLNKAELTNMDLNSVTSSHKLPLKDSISLAENLGLLPADIKIIGIEIGQTNILSNISPCVANACEMLAEKLVSDLLF